MSEQATMRAWRTHEWGAPRDVLKLDTWPPEAMKRHGTVYALTWGRDTAAETIDRFVSGR